MTINYAEKYKAILDLAYQQASTSIPLESNTGIVQSTDNPKIVKVAKMALQGLGDYAREGVAGSYFPQGNIDLTWEPYQLEFDRARTFHIDAMTDVESEGLPAANVMVEFVRTQVVPEVDAIRYSRLADNAGTKVTGDLTKETILEAIDTAGAALDNKEAPSANRILYLTPNNYQLLKQSLDGRRMLVPGQNENRNFMTLDDMLVVKVPQNRFYTSIDMQSGRDAQSAGGFKKGTTGKEINFILMHLGSASAITKHSLPRLFRPEANLNADAWKIDYRLYHDLIVPSNKKSGIYVNSKA